MNLFEMSKIIERVIQGEELIIEKDVAEDFCDRELNECLECVECWPDRD